MSDPTLAEVIKKAIEQSLTNVHTSLPGQIESYDSSTGLASVKPLLKRKYAGEADATEYPIISGVPVIFPRFGNAFLRLPVAKGDNVLLVFIERSIDKWLSQGGIISPNDPAKFSLNDAVAIPGLYPKNDSISANGADSSLEISVGTSWIEIKSDGSIYINATKAVINSLDVNLGDESGNKIVTVADFLGNVLDSTAGPCTILPAGGTLKTKAS